MKTSMFFLLLFTALPAYSQSWTPMDCQDHADEISRFFRSGMSVQEQRQQFKAVVLEARPGDPIYAPRPYPQTLSDLTENLRYAVEEVMIGGSSLGDLPPGLQRLAGALRDGRLSVKALRVENWSLSRCRPRQPKPFHHLLRLYEGDEEFGRCALHDTGVWGQCAFTQGTEAGGGAKVDLLGLSVVREHLANRFGLDWKIGRAQYVTADGSPFCSPVNPCIAFRRGTASYLLVREKVLFELDLSRTTGAAEYRRQKIETGLQSLAVQSGSSLETSIGFGWTDARLVAGSPEDLP